MQIVLGENPFVAGCILLPGCFLGALLAPVSGKLLDKFGVRKPILIVFFIILSAFCFNNFLTTADVLHLAMIYVIFTLGQGFTSGNTMVSGLQRLANDFKADGNAIFNTLQQLAGAIGTAMVATVVSMPQADFLNDLSTATPIGSQNACLLLLVLAIIQFICMFFVTRD